MADDFANQFGAFLDGAPTAEPPKPRNDFASQFGAFLDDEDEQRRTRAELNLHDANKSNPDQAAKARALGTELGLPADTVERNLPEVEDRSRLDRQSKLLRESPMLSRWLAEQDGAAKVAHDDLDNLSGLDRLLGEMGRGLQSRADVARALPAGAVEATGMALSGLGELYDVAVRGVTRGAQGVGLGFLADPSIPALPSFLDPAQILGQPGELLKDLGEAIGPDKERENAATDIAGGLGQMAAQIGGLLVLGPAAGTAALFGQGADIQAERVEQAGKQGTPEGDAAITTGAAITALTERMGLDAILNRVPPQIRNVVLRQLADISIAGGIEAAQEVVEGIFQDLTTRALVDPNAPIFEGLERDAIAAGGAGALMRGIVNALTPGRQIQRDRDAAAAAEPDAQRLDEVAALVGQSKLLQRDPGALESFLATAAGENANVYIPAEALATYFQTDDDGAFSLADDWGVGDQYPSALASGGDVVMPAATYLARVAPEHHAALREEIRIRPDGMSIREAKDFEESYQEFLEAREAELLEQTQAAKAEMAPAERVHDEVLTQARQAGYTLDTARPYAALMAARYNARAQRLGVDPYELYQSVGLQIRQELPEALAEYRRDNLDVLINALRSGRESQDKPSMMGPSLLDWIARRGGIADPGGELAAMDAGQWHRGRPGRRRLLRDTESTAGQTSLPGGPAGVDGGQSRFDPDTVALDAWQEGYFPELTERPTPDQLFDAIREEMAGRPRHLVDQGASDPKALFRAALRDMEETLSRLDIDPKTATNEQIRAALDQATAVPEGGFDQVSPEQARAIAVPVEMPADPLFAEAVANTPGAAVTADGLLIDLVRFQKPEQSGATAVRTGVFYLPVGSSNARHYKVGGTPGKWYGGPVKVQGQTLIKRPLFVKGATGGKAPEAAYDAIKGKGASKKLNDAALAAATSPARMREEVVEQFLSEHGADSSMAWEIIENSKVGNQLTYALQENVVAHAVREAGYDAVIGHSKAKGSAVISEVFDVREIDYPTPGETATLHPQFKSYEQPAYHGSPHVFDRFSLDKIGTGEGAQAYGWGLYFAGKKEVAQYYRDALAKSKVWADRNRNPVDLHALANDAASGDPMALAANWLLQRTDVDGAIDELDATPAADFIGGEEEKRATRRGLTRFLAQGLARRPGGRLYEVEIPDDGEYLLWDKPLSEQPKGVQKALRSIPRVIPKMPGLFGPSPDAGIRAEWAEMMRKGSAATGEQFYRALMRWKALERPGKITARTAPLDALRDASLALREAGLPGIKYLDGTSRATTDGELLSVAKGDDGKWRAKVRVQNRAVAFSTPGTSITTSRGYDTEAEARAWADDAINKGSYNYVIFDDSLVQVRSYEQEARGKITFTDSGAIISLFRGRDLSTLLHETGHLYLEELAADAANEAAPEQVRNDLATVRQWLGAEGDAPFTVDQHEQFARGFEAYLLEGKAPNPGLAGAFERFKSWLLTIYRTVARLNVAITDDVRAVFDRLVATDEEIAAARDMQRVHRLFDSAEQAGMTEAEFAAYTRSVEEAKSTADTDALRRVMADVRERRTEEWKREEETVRGEVSEEFNRRPDLSALHYLRTGRRLDGGEAGERMRLSREALVDMYGSEQVLADLPGGVPPIFTKTGGAHPDFVAEMFGYRSGDDLVNALMSLAQQERALRERGDKRNLRQYLIEEETRLRMEDRHGDALRDGSIQEEALNAIHSDQQAAVISTELRALGRRTGQTPTPLQIARDWAKRTIAEKSVKDGTAVNLYARAEAKAGRGVERALSEGNFEEAYRQKQAQLINHVLFVEAKRAAEDVERGVAQMGKLAGRRTMKSMDQDYLEQIHGLLERFEFKRVTGRELERRRAFADWVAEQEAAGVDVVAPTKLMSDAFQVNYTQMTVAEFRGLHDTVKQVAHLGRLKKKLQDGQEKREFDALVDEARSQAEQLPQLATSAVRNPLDAGSGIAEGLRAKREWLVGNLRSADAALLKMETVFDWLDRDNPNGVFNRIVFRRISDAQNRENELQREYTGKLLGLINAMPAEVRKGMQTRHVLPELPDKEGRPQSLMKSHILAIALNSGNAENFDKLLRGERWTPEGVQAVLDRHMTKADWDFVQGVWDTIDGLWPEIAAMERRVNGVAPPKVEARTVQTRFGEYRGGYYPLRYDATLSFDVEQNRQRSADQLFENNYVRATTPKGHTKERNEGYARPLLLSLDVIPGHLRQVIHDIAFREAVMDADRFLADKRVREAIETTMGREVYKQFRPWLQHIANDTGLPSQGLDFWNRVLRGARTNATIVGLGLRASTVIMQTVGYSDSAEAIGARWLGSGMRAFYGSPQKMLAARDFVFGKSGEMANRMNSLDRDIRDGLRGLIGQAGPVAQVQRFAFHGIGFMDMMVTIPTWLGAYNKGMSEGMAEQDAVYYADKMVRQSQGSGAPKDLAAIVRPDNEFKKLFTMFYSYFSHLYQRQRNLGRDVRNATAADIPGLLARSWWLLVMPPIASSLLGNQGPEDDEDWGVWAVEKVLLNLFMGVPGLREAASAVDRGFGFSVSPVTRIPETIGRTAQNAGRALGLVEGDPSERWLKQAMEATGFLLGLPLGQPGNTVQFLHDVMEGDQNPEDIGDWLKGLTFGPQKD